MESVSQLRKLERNLRGQVFSLISLIYCDRKFTLIRTTIGYRKKKSLRKNKRACFKIFNASDHKGTRKSPVVSRRPFIFSSQELSIYPLQSDLHELMQEMGTSTCKNKQTQSQLYHYCCFAECLIKI